MSYIRELRRNVAATRRLQARYYRLTSAIGGVAGAFGLAGVVLLSRLLARWLGVPMDDPACGHQGNALWGILFLTSIPVVLGISALLFGSVAGLVMVRMGMMDPTEARYYVLRSRYPARWFRSPDDVPRYD